MRIARSVSIAVVLCVAGLGLAEIVREGSGQRRDALDKMELTDFPPSAWSDLDGWTNGDALNADNTAGKVVLVCTWSSWYRVSLKALPVAQQMSDQFGDKGLIVVGVHHPEGWDGAADMAASRGVTFRVAHDTAGKFREVLRVDQDPDFYLIDRAGRLRLADITTGSVPEAVMKLVGETQKEADDLPRIRAERKAAAEAKARMTGTITKGVAVTRLPAVPPGYMNPPPTSYEMVKWPKFKDDNKRRGSRRDEPTESKVSFPPDMTWYPAPPTVQGRVIVTYFLDISKGTPPSQVLSYMDLIQRTKGRDVAVVGVMTRFVEQRRRRDENEDDITMAKLQQRFEQLVKSRKFEHTLLFDPANVLLQSLDTDRRSSGRREIQSLLLIASSDGVVRWRGFNGRTFEAALEQIIRLDPGVKLRKQLDEVYVTGRAPGG